MAGPGGTADGVAEDWGSTPEEHAEDKQRQLKERLRTIVGRLDKVAMDRVRKKDVIEKQWLQDLSQYHGRYSEKLVNELKEDRKSTLYINSTRPKTNSMASKLSDMLFPTDDRNWGIKPTPVPELTVEAEEAARLAAETALMAAENPDDPEVQDIANEAEANSVRIQKEMDEAKKRARSMEAEIEDQFVECGYNSECRDIIEDGCKLGSGILKGPFVGEKARQAWRVQELVSSTNPDGTVADTPAGPAQSRANKEWGLTDEEDLRPMYARANPWNFFPDLDVEKIEDGEGNFERHLMNKRQLKKLARQPGFDKDEIRQLLIEGSTETLPTYVTEIRSITGAQQNDDDDRYHVWEYHGPLEMEDVALIADFLGISEKPDQQKRAQGIREDLKTYSDSTSGFEVDPLIDIECVIWFCQGRLLKFGLHFLDSGEPIYSVWNLERNDSSIFGFGVPYIIRDPQAAMASSWRALMDNMGLSAGPQVVINKDVVKPENGIWALEPRKIWLRQAGGPKGEAPFEIVNIPSNLEELSATIDLCKQNVDEESAQPMIAQGEQGANVTKTAQGMGLLMNSANIVFKRVVKNWDDQITKPSVRRIYHFNMQFSKKEYIKGDYQVDARGSSVLLVREMQSANLLLFLTNFSGHPVLGKFLREEGVQGLRRLAQTMMIPADDLVKSDEEIKQDRAEAAKQPPAPDPEMEKIMATLEATRMKIDGDLMLEEMRRETAMMTYAAQANLKLDELRAMLQKSREESASKERLFAAEAAMTPPDTKGGGGSL